jgi:hypothetical protein
VIDEDMCFDEREAHMEAVAEQFDKSVERKATRPEFINFNKHGLYVIRVLPSRNYLADFQWFRKLGKGSPRPRSRYIINVVMPNKRDIVQTAEVPQTFIKFLRTFQNMVNMLFCDPEYGSLIVFEVVPAANGFGNEYKMLKHQPMPVNFSREQTPDLDELLKAATGGIKPMSAFSGNLASPIAAINPAPTGLSGPAAPPAAPADFGRFGGFAAARAQAAAATPAASPARSISDAEAADLQARLLAMVGQG